MRLMLLGEADRPDGKWEYYGYELEDAMEIHPFCFVSNKRIRPLGIFHDVEAELFLRDVPPGAAG